MEGPLTSLASALLQCGVDVVVKHLPGIGHEDLVTDEELDTIFDEMDERGNLKEMLGSVTSSLSQLSRRREGSVVADGWKVLQQNGITPGAFSGFIQVLMRAKADLSRLHLSLEAGHIFLKFSHLNASKHNQFSTLCFRSTFSLLHRLVVVASRTEVADASAQKSSARRRSSAGRPKKRKRGGSDEMSEDVMLQLSLDEDDDDRETVLGASDLIKQGVQLADEMQKIMQAMSFDNTAEWFRSAILTTLVVFDDTKKCSEASQKSLIRAGVKLLEAMTLKGHGAQSSALREMLRHSVHQIGMIDSPSIVPKGYRRVREALLSCAEDLLVQVLDDANDEEKEGIAEAVQTFCQYIAYQVPDKAEVRHLAAETVCELCSIMVEKGTGKAFLDRFVRFISRLSRNQRAPLRHTAVEIACRCVTTMSDVLQSDASTRYVLLSLLMERVNDKSASVRAKTLTSIAIVIDEGEVQPQDFYHPATIVSPSGGGPVTLIPTTGGEEGEGPTPITPGVPSTPASPTRGGPSPASALRATPVLSPPPTTREGLYHTLQVRCKDEKPGVRKGALQVLGKVYAAAVSESREEEMEEEGEDEGRDQAKHGRPGILSSLFPLAFELCLDPAVSVRRQAVNTCCSIFAASRGDTRVQMHFVEYTLPLLNDAEQGVVDDLVPRLVEIAFHPLSFKAKDKVNKRDREDALSFFGRLKHDDGKLVRKAIDLAKKKKEINDGQCKNMWAVLMSAFWYGQDDDDRQGGEEEGEGGSGGKKREKSIVKLGDRAPLLSTVQALTEVVPASSNADEVEELWQACSRELSSFKKSRPPQVASVIADISARSLDLLASVSDRLEPGTARTEADKIIGHLHLFCLHPAVVKSMLHALPPLFAGSDNGEKDLTTAIQSLMRDATKKLKKMIADETELTTSTAHQQSVLLFTIGEAAMILGEKCSDETVKVVKACIDSDNRRQSGVGVSGAHPFSPTSDESTLEAGTVHVELRAHSLLALGKLSLCDEALAKKSIALLLKEMKESQHAAVRNNVLIVLCEMCVQFTSLVDNYVGKLSACLRDPNRLVRRHAVALLTALLQAEYIKWKGPIFFHFLAAVVDKDQQVRQLAKVCLTKLAQKYSSSRGKSGGTGAAANEKSLERNLFVVNFIETFFVLNGYAHHEKYNRFAASEEERSHSTLAGEEEGHRRREIYRYLLSNVSAEQKFLLIGRICQDVLSAYADKYITIPDGSGEGEDSPEQGILVDVLWVLSAPEMKPSPARGASALSGAEGVEGEEEALIEARGKIFSRLARKNLMENVVPILAELKRLLERMHSPLLRHLLSALTEMTRDYKEEIKEIVAADKQLAREIEFDLRDSASVRRMGESGQVRPQTPRAPTPRSEMKSSIRGSVSVPQLKMKR
mmetsp:Transcript_25687/g.64635  ORF Transcript_25687/g.64635 Transcript_25687/m.64635 type:complete len:1390 (-) Transcript_25687:1856-6025(-)